MVATPSSSSSSSVPDPSWILKDPSSFASIHVKLPPHQKIHCEPDAIITFCSNDPADTTTTTTTTNRTRARISSVQVRTVLSGTGSLWSALIQRWLTKESFFTTIVENTSSNHAVADVMMAPKEPGGIVLHKLYYGTTEEDLFLTSGSYIASDASVHITAQVQSNIANFLFSGTGLFLLRASGQGYVACGAYGSLHKFVLLPGQVRAVDNGHLVAWTAGTRYSIGLASSSSASSSLLGGLWNSATSGEGLMCFFEGPGIIYLQSHKPDVPTTTTSHGRPQYANNTHSSAACSCMNMVCLLGFFLVLLQIISTFAALSTQFQLETTTYGNENNPNNNYYDLYNKEEERPRQRHRQYQRRRVYNHQNDGEYNERYARIEL